MQIYDQLLKFQLFQGLSRNELLQMAGNTKFGFAKLAPGQLVNKDGSRCQQLNFLISGQLTLTTCSDDRAYQVDEELSAPWLLQPEVLFGAHPLYTATARAATEVHLITLSKDEVMRLIDDFLIVRLNLFNLMSTMAQRRGRLNWRRLPPTLRDRLVRFLIDHVTYPAGHKTFHILMERLAQELGDSRLNISRTLNAMQAEGLLQLHRGRIEIPSLERLLM